MGSDLSVLTIYHFGGGPNLSLCMTYNDADDFANQWMEYTKRFKDSMPDDAEPMVKLSGKISPTDNRIVTWFLDFRDIQTLNIA